MTIDAHILDGFNSLLLAATQVELPATPASGGGNIFDILVGVLLIVGMIRGKKRGMSEELLDLFKWLLVVVVAAYGYERMGDWLNKSAPVIPKLIAYIACYLFVLVVISAIFATIKRKMGEKVFESDLFGAAEYPLGMLAGVVRYGCMIMVVLAVLNAFKLDYAQAEIKKKSQEKSMGEGMAIVPSREALHQGIFVGSITGQFIKKHKEDLLIKPTDYISSPGGTTDLPSKVYEKEVDKAINGTPKK